MKPKTVTIAITLSVAALAVPARLVAQDKQVPQRPVLYAVKELPTLGGSGAAALGINDIGWVVGNSNLSGDQSGHAYLWRAGVMTGLGTLGGLNSDAITVTNNGLIAGAAETAAPDPLSENVCPFALLNTPSTPATGLICRGVLWREGVISGLPTLGGNNGSATGVNSLGQVVGWAETSTKDPTCVSPQVLDYLAVVWGPGKGEIHALPPLPGDTTSVATDINERGQVVGESGPCVSPEGPFSLVFPPHGVIWEQGHATNLGSLGGTQATSPYVINNRGQVVGASNLTGDVGFHAFLWQKGVMADLGVLPGDVDSVAFGLNDLGQAVGSSIGANFSAIRAFLWQNGVMTDLNTLIKPGSTSLYLVFANLINSRGEIAGEGLDPAGELRAFLAIPCDTGHASDKACAGGPQGATAASAQNGAQWLPSPSLQGIRARLQQSLSGRFAAGLMGLR